MITKETKSGKKKISGADFWHLRFNGNTCLLSASHLKGIMQVKIDKIVGSVI